MIVGLYLTLKRTSSELEDHKVTDVCPSRKHPRARLPAITANGTASTASKSWDTANTSRRVRYCVKGSYVYTFDGIIRK